MTDIYEKLDSGIEDVVYILRDNGFDTVSSCEGGNEHEYRFPIVIIKPSGDMIKQEKELIKVLKASGYTSMFTVKQCRTYYYAEIVETIELEFNTIPVLRYGARRVPG